MSINLKPIQKIRVTMEIISTTPMIQHKWSEKGKTMMREKHQGKKTKNREIRDAELEFAEAGYRTASGEPAIPAMAIKSAIIGAAHKDIGIEKTLVRKALFLVCDSDLLIPIKADAPIMREDVVRVGIGKADLRYRPEFSEWSAVVTFDIDGELLRIEDLVNLIDRAGFGIGIGEWRPEKGGEYGRFCVNPKFGIQQFTEKMGAAA